MYFQGVNIGGYFSQIQSFTEEHLTKFITEEDVKAIKKWGFNIIRLPIDYFFFEEDSKLYQYREDRLSFIDKVLDWTLKHGITLILDLHKAPGHSFDVRENQNNDIWVKGSENRIQFLKIWDMLSQRYEKYENVMYEILNEPTAPNDTLWHDLVDETIETIRNNDEKHYIVVESNLWGRTATFKNLKKFDDKKIIYSFHFYEPIVVTHQMAEWVPFVYNNIYRKYVQYPGRPAGFQKAKEEMAKTYPQLAHFFDNQDKYWDRNELEELLNPVLTFRDKFDVPILCGEFGCFVKAEPETRQNWLRDLIFLFKKHQISYTYWSYKNMDFGILDLTEQYADNPNYSKEDRTDSTTLKILQSGIDDTKGFNR